MKTYITMVLAAVLGAMALVSCADTNSDNSVAYYHRATNPQR